LREIEEILKTWKKHLKTRRKQNFEEKNQFLCIIRDFDGKYVSLDVFRKTPLGEDVLCEQAPI
jgi:hypothetical protein